MKLSGLKVNLKLSVAIGASVGCMFSLFAEMSLSNARAKIGDAISNPATMTAVTKELSPADQCAYLAEVNAAIGKMPGSTEAKTAMFWNACTAALKGSAKGNAAALLAEVFATVPPEALTVINEQLAQNMFNRAADPSVTYSDEQYETIAKLMMDKVNARVATADNGAARSAFALLMLVRASNGTPANLAETLTDKLPEDVREAASEEWIPSALGKDGEKSYEPILAFIDAGKAPNPGVTINIAGPQTLVSMLGDLVEGTPISRAQHDVALRNNPDVGAGAGDGIGGGMVIPADPSLSKRENSYRPSPHPRPYPNQRTR